MFAGHYALLCLSRACVRAHTHAHALSLSLSFLFSLALARARARALSLSLFLSLSFSLSLSLSLPPLSPFLSLAFSLSPSLTLPRSLSLTLPPNHTHTHTHCDTYMCARRSVQQYRVYFTDSLQFTLPQAPPGTFASMHSGTHMQGTQSNPPLMYQATTFQKVFCKSLFDFGRYPIRMVCKTEQAQSVTTIISTSA